MGGNEPGGTLPPTKNRNVQIAGGIVHQSRPYRSNRFLNEAFDPPSRWVQFSSNAILDNKISEVKGLKRI